MSGYLNRLITRTQEKSDRSFSLPVIRTRSPIAEYDQRIGMSEFDGSEFGVSLTSPDPDGEPNFEPTDQSRSTGITTIGGMGSDVVQRKVANAGITGGDRKDGSAIALPSPPVHTRRVDGAVDKRQRVENLEPNTQSIHSPHLGDFRAQNPLHQASPPKSLPDLHPLPGEEREHPDDSDDSGLASVQMEPSQELRPNVVSPLIGTEPEAWSDQSYQGLEIAQDTHQTVQSTQTSVPTSAALPNSVPNSLEAFLGEPLEIRDRQSRVKPVSPQNPTQLEPVRRSRPDLEALMARQRHQALNGVMETNNQPRVVIGRINVEVVPPPVESSRAKPPAKPLTAASVSVIGPLGGGVRPNVRLSLRQR